MRGVLIPEIMALEDGIGEAIPLGEDQGKPLLLTLDITRVLEQESVDISLWGSADQRNWRQLVTYPQKSYCGSYPLMLDLTRHPEVAYLRAQWKMSRWGLNDRPVLAAFHLSAEELKIARATA